MKIKKGDYVEFSTPIGNKKGHVASIEGNDYMIKADTYPYSNWKTKLSDIISKLNKNE